LYYLQEYGSCDVVSSKISKESESESESEYKEVEGVESKEVECFYVSGGSDCSEGFDVNEGIDLRDGGDSSNGNDNTGNNTVKGKNENEEKSFNISGTVSKGMIKESVEGIVAGISNAAPPVIGGLAGAVLGKAIIQA
jgi:hypothetical protein